MPTPQRYRFSRRFEVLPVERKLLVDGEATIVGGRAFDLLLVLIEHRHRMLTKDELLDLVWPEVAVEPNNLAVQIGALRKLLGADAIATIPGRGYRFSVALDESSAPPAPTPAPPAATLKTNLPGRPEALIGRDEESAALAALVDRHSLVTIIGAGGIGKSRLAQQLLHDRRAAYAHGVCWIELSSVTEPAALPVTLASALGIDLGGGEPGAALRAALAPLTMLVALDNAEHLLEDVASLAMSLTAAAPTLRLVVTSQAPLHVAREQVYRLDALAVPPRPMPAAQALEYGAIELFVDRARGTDARFEFVDKDAAAVIDLCRRLDGLPLAIELAASRAPVLGVQRIIESLDERLHLLKGGMRDAPPRQQTLRAALEWSHGLLGGHERAVFRRLAVIAGSASLELVQRIAADADPADGGAQDPLDRWAVVDALSGLVDRSLVAVANDGDGRERPRYRLLDSPRAYADERLRESGERERVAELHARAIAELLEASWEERWSGRVGVAAWRSGLEPERDNARIALDWAVARGDLPLVLKMAPVLLWRTAADVSHEAKLALAEVLEALLATVPPAPSQLQARTSLAVFWGMRQQQKALAQAQAAMALARAHGEDFMLYVLLSTVAYNALRVGDHALTAASLAEMHAVENPAWPPHRLYWGVQADALCVGVEAGAAASLPLWRKAIALVLASGESAPILRSNLAAAELMAGDVTAAVSSGQALVEELQFARNEYALVQARVNLVEALLAQGDVAAARPVAEAAWARAADFDVQAPCADDLAWLAALEGRWDAAARLIGYATAAYTRKGAPRLAVESYAFDRAVALCRSALGEDDFEHRVADGASLHDAQIADIAFVTGIGH